MCILLNVKKHEKTFALNVDIFKESLKIEKRLDIQELHLYNNLACIFRDAYLI